MQLPGLQALEAFALAEEPSELEEFEDPTEPEALDSSRLQRADAFKVRPYIRLIVPRLGFVAGVWELIWGPG